MTSHSARLHALAAALCALLLLAALALMDANHAPWWALLGTQGMLLVATASAAMWLDRGVGRRGDEAMREDGQGDPLWWAEMERKQNGRQRRFRAGVDGPRDDDDVFWQERVLRWNKEDES